MISLTALIRETSIAVRWIKMINIVLNNNYHTACIMYTRSRVHNVNNNSDTR